MDRNRPASTPPTAWAHPVPATRSDSLTISDTCVAGCAGTKSDPRTPRDTKSINASARRIDAGRASGSPFGPGTGLHSGSIAASKTAAAAASNRNR